MNFTQFRCVAALAVAMLGLPFSPAHATPVGRFVVSGAEVTDAMTGLVWRVCAEGQTFNGSGCDGEPWTFLWEEALAQAQSEADATGVAWRLPNVKELASLIDPTLASPALDTVYFPGAPSVVFWSSTPQAQSKAGAWAINFAKGGASPQTHTLYFAARLVRKGRP